MLGLRRVRAGAGFVYTDAHGRRIRDPGTLQRIGRIAIPPAWTHVWICPVANGHIQAVGRDARGRKQYRYHQRWREIRDATKFHKLIAFSEALRRIRAAVERDLSRRGLPREKVLATVVRLLEITRIRVGNDEYARENGSFGLTTLRNGHVRTRGTEIIFRFRGKGGKDHEVGVRDPRLARIVRACAPCAAGSARTRNVKECIEQVAAALRNTPAVCRRSYVHPGILDAYMSGALERVRARSDEGVVLAVPAREEDTIRGHDPRGT